MYENNWLHPKASLQCEVAYSEDQSSVKVISNLFHFQLHPELFQMPSHRQTVVYIAFITFTRYKVTCTVCRDIQ